MPARFQHFQEVRVTAPLPENRLYLGTVGTILGIGDAPGFSPVYGLEVPNEEAILTFEEAELTPTGRQRTREEFYRDDDALRVRVDAEGRGTFFS